MQKSSFEYNCNLKIIFNTCKQFSVPITRSADMSDFQKKSTCMYWDTPRRYSMECCCLGSETERMHCQGKKVRWGYAAEFHLPYLDLLIGATKFEGNE